MPEIPDVFYKFHKRGGHTVTYIIINQESGSTSYYQYMSTDGWWYIMKSVKTATVTVYTYTKPVSISTTTAAAGWTGRAGLDYDTPDNSFGE